MGNFVVFEHSCYQFPVGEDWEDTEEDEVRQADPAVQCVHVGDAGFVVEAEDGLECDDAADDAYGLHQHVDRLHHRLVLLAEDAEHQDGWQQAGRTKKLMRG